MPLSFHFVAGIGLVYGTSFVFRFLERYNFPILAVEILAGIVFGSVLGLVGQGSPGYQFILHLAAFGLLMVMFDAGLELNPEVIRQNPRTVGTLAAFTFVLPFLAGSDWPSGSASPRSPRFWSALQCQPPRSGLSTRCWRTSISSTRTPASSSSR